MRSSRSQHHAALLESATNWHFLVLLLGLCIPIGVLAASDYSIEWVDNTITVLDERRIVMHFEYKVANIQECNRGETELCLFRPSVHIENVETATCNSDPLTLDSAITVGSVEITTSSVNVYVEVDVVAAADAKIPGLVVDDTLSICVQLNSYAAAGNLLVNSFQVIQRAILNATGIFILAQPVTTEASGIRDIGGSDGDSFQIPIVVAQCSSEQQELLLVQHNDNNDSSDPILDLCVTASNPEFTSVSSLLEAKVERPDTMAEQTVIQNGALVDAASTVLECSSGQCRIRIQLDLVALGQETGTLRFSGVAALSVGNAVRGRRDRRRQLDSAQPQQQAFDYEFELVIVWDETSAASFIRPLVPGWIIKQIILLLVTTTTLVLCFG